MTSLPKQNHRLAAKAVPVLWRDTAWNVRVIARSVAPVIRRLAGLAPMSRSGASLRTRANALEMRQKAGLVRGQLGRAVPVRIVGRPLAGKISKHRRLSCDPAAVSRLAAFASLPLCQPAPRLRIFRYFQHPECAL